MSTTPAVPAPISQFFSFAEESRLMPGVIGDGSRPTSQRDEFSDEVKAILSKPLPKEALTQAPRGLTGLKPIFVTERMNEAFGQGRWFFRAKLVERLGKEVVVHLVLCITDHPWFYGEAFGGNSNVDLGDAYKGACTDALTKIAAHQLHIGLDVYKGQGAVAAAAEEKKDKAEAVGKKTTAATQPAGTPASTEPTTAVAEPSAAEKKAVVAAQTAAARETVANPPQCVDCNLTITSWTHPTNKKVYDAADLIANSQNKYGKNGVKGYTGPDVNLCADCQGKRAMALKAQSKVADRTQ